MFTGKINFFDNGSEYNDEYTDNDGNLCYEDTYPIPLRPCDGKFIRRMRLTNGRIITEAYIDRKAPKINGFLPIKTYISRYPVTPYSRFREAVDYIKIEDIDEIVADKEVFAMIDYYFNNNSARLFAQEAKEETEAE